VADDGIARDCRVQVDLAIAEMSSIDGRISLGQRAAAADDAEIFPACDAGRG